ncbi:hypothetical protein QWJ34_08955 [Saccharibacillus sp. CPCC 101409]|uniref:hypothetical protein n=1 Tax=Saccharibacillus sp. CPCC 101409 TaxID=3058041 RepID=UPI0026718123|nr:hypothetical protein [Saccharibacillus sp. CPCC 101409]MDO3409889.1 hypothetical protein [Saccharibacillus sp. CPCC 101409]
MILNKQTGEFCPVEFAPLTKEDLPLLTVRRGGWIFGARRWAAYLDKPDVFPVKMTLRNSDRIEGIVVYRNQPDMEGLFVLWIESAAHNRRFDESGDPDFDHVVESLLAYTCSRSYEWGYDYFIALQCMGHPILHAFYRKLGLMELPFNRYMGVMQMPEKFKSEPAETSLQTIADLTAGGKLVAVVGPEGISAEDAGKILEWKRGRERN